MFLLIHALFRTTIDFYGRYISGDPRYVSKYLSKILSDIWKVDLLLQYLELIIVGKLLLDFCLRKCTSWFACSEWARFIIKSWTRKFFSSIDNPFYSRYNKLPKVHFSKEIIRPYYTGWVVQKISNLLDPMNMHILRIHQVSQIMHTWISLEGSRSFGVLSRPDRFAYYNLCVYCTARSSCGEMSAQFLKWTGPCGFH